MTDKPEGFGAWISAVRTKDGVVHHPTDRINVTDLIDIDRVRGIAITERVTVAELKARWPELSVTDDEAFEVNYDFHYNHSSHPASETFQPNPENMAYDPDPDGIGRFGWRKPGMHLRKVPHPDVVYQHGPGKRKKYRRKK